MFDRFEASDETGRDDGTAGQNYLPRRNDQHPFDLVLQNSDIMIRYTTYKSCPYYE